MRVNRPLDQILDNKNKVAILRHLVLYPSEVATGRSLARELGMNQATCNNALNSLHRAGIVTRKHAGRSTLYEIARDTAVCEELLKPLFQRETKIPREAVRMLVRGLEAKSIRAFLFGSEARGTDAPESDTDILLVIDDKADRERVLERLSENTPEAYKRFHTGFNVVLLTESELARKLKRKERFVTAAIAEAISIEVGVNGKEATDIQS
jgi:predicted nucleotidyltransferase/DNA-binding HxlR family transcriptional regulator